MTTENNFKLIKEIQEYFIDAFEPIGVIVYGSFLEKYMGIGFDSKPNDIDVMIIVENVPEKNEKSFYLEMVDVVINAEFCTEEQYKTELERLEPKHYLSNCSNDKLTNLRTIIHGSRTTAEIRSKISAITSRAFDKGRKKLLLEDDYDEVLGLKNLFHAFKFPLYAKWSYFGPNDLFEDVKYLNEVRKNIYEIYENSTGTLEERTNAVVQYAKPLHNALMTEFRKQFPKDIT